MIQNQPQVHSQTINIENFLLKLHRVQLKQNQEAITDFVEEYSVVFMNKSLMNTFAEKLMTHASYGFESNTKLTGSPLGLKPQVSMAKSLLNHAKHLLDEPLLTHYRLYVFNGMVRWFRTMMPLVSCATTPIETRVHILSYAMVQLNVIKPLIIQILSSTSIPDNYLPLNAFDLFYPNIIEGMIQKKFPDSFDENKVAKQISVVHQIMLKSPNVQKISHIQEAFVNAIAYKPEVDAPEGLKELFTQFSGINPIENPTVNFYVMPDSEMIDENRRSLQAINLEIQGKTLDYIQDPKCSQNLIKTTLSASIFLSSPQHFTMADQALLVGTLELWLHTLTNDVNDYNLIFYLGLTRLIERLSSPQICLRLKDTIDLKAVHVPETIAKHFQLSSPVDLLQQNSMLQIALTPLLAAKDRASAKHLFVMNRHLFHIDDEVDELSALIEQLYKAGLPHEALAVTSFITYDLVAIKNLTFPYWVDTLIRFLFVAQNPELMADSNDYFARLTTIYDLQIKCLNHPYCKKEIVANTTSLLIVLTYQALSRNSHLPNFSILSEQAKDKLNNLKSTVDSCAKLDNLDALVLKSHITSTLESIESLPQAIVKEKQIDEMTQLVDQLTQKLQVKDTTLRSYEISFSSYKKQLSEKNITIHQLQATLNKKEGELSKLKQQSATHVSTLQTAKDSLQGLMQDKALLEERIEKLDHTLTELEDHAQETKAYQAVLESRNASLMHQVEELTQNFESLQVKHSEQASMIAILQEKEMARPAYLPKPDSFVTTEHCITEIVPFRTASKVHIPDDIIQLLTELEGDGRYHALIEGGYVRAAFTQTPTHDVDIITSCPKEWILKHVPNVQENPFRDNHLTLLSNKYPYPIDLTVHSGINLKELAMRSDLTINALMADKHGNIYDPTGNGLKDLNEHQYQVPSDSVRSTWEKDPAKVLRWLRFHSQLQWPFNIRLIKDAQMALNSMPKTLRFGVFKANLHKLFKACNHQHLHFLYQTDLLRGVLAIKQLNTKLMGHHSLMAFWSHNLSHCQTPAQLLGMFLVIEVLDEVEAKGPCDETQLTQTIAKDYLSKWNEPIDEAFLNSLTNYLSQFYKDFLNYQVKMENGGLFYQYPSQQPVYSPIEETKPIPAHRHHSGQKH